jgi:L-fuconolactonase
MKIIDTHIHLFDTTRPQGVPYPSRDNPVLWKPALPRRYRELAEPLGVTGAIAVEASPWLEDNLWLLETCGTDKFMVGAIGNLEPEKPEFHEYLDRFAKNKLFRGIRYGNLWRRSLRQAVKTYSFLDGVKHLAQAGLSLDTANQDQDLLEAVVVLSDRVPDLRIAIDHLPNAIGHLKDDGALRELAKRPLIYVKVSEVIQTQGDGVERYRAMLDRLWELFGEDRLMFGSDWPNWDTHTSLAESVGLVKAYVSGKSEAAAEKFFWKNSVAVYKWV